MDMNRLIDQNLFEQNALCHETSECRICSADVPIRGTVRVPIGKLSELSSLGWILQYDNATQSALVSKQMGHQLLIGSTGTGKTQCLILNTVNFFSGFSDDVKPNLFMTDPKGEILRRTGNFLEARGYKLVVIDTRHPESSARYNPMFGIFDHYQQILQLEEELKETPKMKKEDYQAVRQRIAMLHDRVERAIAELSNITIPTTSCRDVVWPTGARNMMRAILYTMLYDSESPEITGMTRERFTLENVARIAFSTDEDCGTLIEYLTRASDQFLAVKNALTSNYKILAKQTRDSYISSCNTLLGEYTSYSIASLTASASDFDFDEIVRGDVPHAIFLITDDRNPTTNSICMMFLNHLISDLIDYADENADQSLQRDFVFLCDEFANMPEMPSITNKITMLRSRKIWLLMAIQSLEQLQMVYGQEVSEIIQDNCDFQVYLGSNNQKTKEQFAASFGKKIGIKTSFSISNDGSISGSKYTEDVPVVKKSDLEQLQLGEFYVRSRVCGNFKSDMVPYFRRKDIDHQKLYDSKILFHVYEEKYRYDIAAVLKNEEKAARKAAGWRAEETDRLSDVSDEQEDTDSTIPYEKFKRNPFFYMPEIQIRKNDISEQLDALLEHFSKKEGNHHGSDDDTESP